MGGPVWMEMQIPVVLGRPAGSSRAKPDQYMCIAKVYMCIFLSNISASTTEQWEAEPTQCREGQQFMQLNQNQMCMSVTDPGRETWDLVLFEGLARETHFQHEWACTQWTGLGYAAMCWTKKVWLMYVFNIRGRKARDMFHITSHWI